MEEVEAQKATPQTKKKKPKQTSMGPRTHLHAGATVTSTVSGGGARAGEQRVVVGTSGWRETVRGFGEERTGGGWRCRIKGGRV